MSATAVAVPIPGVDVPAEPELVGQNLRHKRNRLTKAMRKAKAEKVRETWRIKMAARAAANPPPPPPERPRNPNLPPRPVPKTHVELYGQQWPKDAPRIAVEFACYRENWPKEKGGLGREEHFRRAFRLMWPKYEWSEWVDHIIWAWCNFKWIVIIGHERASKTYTMAHCALLDYCCDPTSTLTSLATVTFEGLKLRMWSDLLRAAETAEGYPTTSIMAIRSSTNELRLYPK